jgi:hypothetical protein
MFSFSTYVAAMCAFSMTEGLESFCDRQLQALPSLLANVQENFASTFISADLFTPNIILGQATTLSSNNASREPPKKAEKKARACRGRYHMHIAKKTMLDPIITSYRNAP